MWRIFDVSGFCSERSLSCAGERLVRAAAHEMGASSVGEAQCKVLIWSFLDLHEIVVLGSYI